MGHGPTYIRTKTNGLLEQKVSDLETLMNPCVLCPRQCRVLRAAGETGYCSAPYNIYIASAFAHFGEEAPLVGSHGSGTIFFTHCNLRCAFCQNYDISIAGEGVEASSGELAGIMLRLQETGCHNINLVTPTHYVPQIVKALAVATDRGLSIPIVYNCAGYESLDVLGLLDGIVDIYMPDIKFLDSALSKRFCRAGDYPDVVKPVIKEMQRQVGDLECNASGNARKGLLIRHLVMPNCGEDTKTILRFMKEEVSENAFVNIMAQYHPCHNAGEYPEIARRISSEEYREAIEYAKVIGLTRASNH